MFWTRKYRVGKFKILLWSWIFLIFCALDFLIQNIKKQQIKKNCRSLPYFSIYPATYIFNWTLKSYSFQTRLNNWTEYFQFLKPSLVKYKQPFLYPKSVGTILTWPGLVLCSGLVVQRGAAAYLCETVNHDQLSHMMWMGTRRLRFKEILSLPTIFKVAACLVDCDGWLARSRPP